MWIFNFSTLLLQLSWKCIESVWKKKRTRTMCTYGAAPFLHLITLICCYLFAPVHVKFIELNLSKFWRNMNCLCVLFRCSFFLSSFYLLLIFHLFIEMFILQILFHCVHYMAIELTWNDHSNKMLRIFKLFILENLIWSISNLRMDMEMKSAIPTFEPSGTCLIFMICSNYMNGWIIWTGNKYIECKGDKRESRALSNCAS